MIRVEGLCKQFTQGRGRKARSVQAVDGVSWVAPDACITGLLGPNGAGKTSSLRMVAGLITPDAGRIEVDGIEVAAEPRRALARMGVLSDARGLYPRLSARENIVYYGMLHGMDRAAADRRAMALAQTLDMEPLLDRRTEGFSQGERMKTALARALVHDPPNVILDETHQWPGRAGHAQPARCVAQAARRGAQVHRVLHPHHAGGRTLV